MSGWARKVLLLLVLVVSSGAWGWGKSGGEGSIQRLTFDPDLVASYPWPHFSSPLFLRSSRGGERKQVLCGFRLLTVLENFCKSYPAQQQNADGLILEEKENNKVYRNLVEECCKDSYGKSHGGCSDQQMLKYCKYFPNQKNETKAQQPLQPPTPSPKPKPVIPVVEELRCCRCLEFCDLPTLPRPSSPIQDGRSEVVEEVTVIETTLPPIPRGHPAPMMDRGTYDGIPYY